VSQAVVHWLLEDASPANAPACAAYTLIAGRAPELQGLDHTPHLRLPSPLPGRFCRLRLHHPFSSSLTFSCSSDYRSAMEFDSHPFEPWRTSATMASTKCGFPTHRRPLARSSSMFYSLHFPTSLTPSSVIAIHGLGTQSLRTWTGKTPDNTDRPAVNWLKDADMLPSQMADARIWTYDWDGAYCDEARLEYMLGHANRFLVDIKGTILVSCCKS
jgi:hypothetical protein